RAGPCAARATWPASGASLAPGESQDAFGQDVLVDLGRPAGDAQSSHRDPLATPLAGVAGRAEHLGGDVGHVTLALAPCQLGQARLGAGLATRVERGQRSVAEELEVLTLEVDGG